MSLNFIGSYSGIDSTAINQLMNIEKRPLIQLNEKKTDMETRKNAWNDVRTRLNTLFEKIKVLEKDETFTSKTATGGANASMTVSKNSPVGDYDVSVTQLATKGSMIGQKVAGGEEGLGKTGTMRINDLASVEVAETDSIYDVSSKINEASATTGVKSSIIDGRLVLTNSESGNRAISISNEDGTILSDLGLDTAETIQGKNALFKVNGVEIERQSNQISDVIESTTINLVKEHESGQTDSISIGQDSEKLTTALKEFVEQYNSTMSFIADKTKSGTPGDAASRGALAGDSALIKLQSSLRGMATSRIDGISSMNNMSEIGITTLDRSGKLVFDESKMKDVNISDIKNFLGSTESGFASRMTGTIDRYASSTGIIRSKTDGFERSIKDIGKQVDRFSMRMEKREAYYMNMFSKLDNAMMQAESQMSWLNSQISSFSPNK